MSFYLMIFLTLLSCFVHYSAGQQCDVKGLQRFDGIFAKLLTLGGSGRLFPEDKQGQLKKYCDQSYEYIQEIDKYKSKCMKQLPKQVTGVVVFAVKNSINKYCKKDSKKLTELIHGATCGNRAKKDFDQCYANLIDGFQGSSNANEKSKLPFMCCEYYKLFECAKARVSKNKNCNEKQIETIENFIKEIFGNVNDLLCQDYVEGSDKCEKLGSPPKKKKSQRRTKSFMLPLIEILDSIKEI